VALYYFSLSFVSSVGQLKHSGGQWKPSNIPFFSEVAIPVPHTVVLKALPKSVLKAVMYFQYHLEIVLSQETKNIIQPLSVD